MHTLATILAWVALVLGVLGTLYVLFATALLTVDARHPSLAPVLIPLALVALAVAFLIFRRQLGL